MTTLAPRPTETSAAPQPDAVRSRRPELADRLPAGPARDRAALVALLAGTAVLYLWGLGASGWANAYYSAAAQAGGESWKAFFFGSFDAAGSITVDKPPLALWPMALSVRLFGLSSWSILVPQALMGVASVALLHALVRRATGSAAAGLLAGAALALTPVATLMFRFNNPDALLTLLLLGSAYAVLRTIGAERRTTAWMVLAGTLVGLAFLTKTLQAFLVLPGLSLAFLLFATVSWRRRILALLAAAGAMVASGGWWVAVVELVPASARPYIGGSQDDSFFELTLGYNGLGRLTGEETGSVGGGGGWGSTGLLRLFGSENGGQIAWLLPAALVLGAVACVVGPRSARAAATAMMGWLLVTAATFSFMAGIYHAYYTVVLAPAVAGLVALGAWALWQRRNSLWAAGLLGFALSLTTAWTFALLARTPDWHPWLRYVVATVGFAAAVLVVLARHLPRRAASWVAVVAMLAALAAPAASSLATAATPHTGSIPSAGPSTGSGFPGGGGGMGGGLGGLLDASTSSPTLTGLLTQDADSYDWVAATVGANQAAGYQLATGESVMPIGGFNGTDPSPTLAEFQELVAAGRIHYFISGSGGGSGMGPGGMTGMAAGPGGDTGTASEITAWVTATYTAETVDGVTVYDLTTAS